MCISGDWRQLRQSQISNYFVLPGTLVPSATNAMAVTASFKPTVHPKCEAKSPITAVRTPIPNMETTNVTYPSNISENKIAKIPILSKLHSQVTQAVIISQENKNTSKNPKTSDFKLIK